MNLEKPTVGLDQPIASTPPQRRILVAIFIEVFLGFFKNLGLGVFNFFKRYGDVIWFSLKFVTYPNAEDVALHRKKAIENSRHTFELILIVTGFVIFLIKQGWINSASEDNKNALSNDFAQWGIELAFFLYNAIFYFVVLILLVLLGRLLRIIFSAIETAAVTDLVFIHLNNIYFLLATIGGFVMRLNNNISELTTDEDYGDYVWRLFNQFGIILAVVIFLFFTRWVMINKLTMAKKILYITIVPAIVWLFLFICQFMISIFLASI